LKYGLRGEIELITVGTRLGGGGKTAKKGRGAKRKKAFHKMQDRVDEPGRLVSAVAGKWQEMRKAVRIAQGADRSRKRPFSRDFGSHGGGKREMR